MQGIFISFEGPDGAGKTTQVRLLAKHLIHLGYTVTVTREPGGTPIGDKIRALLLDASNREMHARTEALLYAAARAQHVQERIAPALARGEVVITDRYADSTIVYQGVARSLDKECLAGLNSFAVNGVNPDITLLLDADVSMLKNRVAGRGETDRIEQEATAFHEAVRQGFLALAAEQPARIKIVSALAAEEQVHEEVASIVDNFLQRRSRLED